MHISLNKDERATLKRAFDKWGENAQIGMAMEELAETITALNHFQRGRVPIGRVIEEFADSIVCVGQVLATKGDPFLAGLEAAVCDALDKLSAKLDKGDHNYVAGRKPPPEGDT